MRGWQTTARAALSLLLAFGFYLIVLGYVIGVAFAGGMLLFQVSRLSLALFRPG